MVYYIYILVEIVGKIACNCFKWLWDGKTNGERFNGENLALRHCNWIVSKPQQTSDFVHDSIWENHMVFCMV